MPVRLFDVDSRYIQRIQSVGLEAQQMNKAQKSRGNIILSVLVMGLLLAASTSCKSVVADYSSLRASVDVSVDPHSGTETLKSGRVLFQENNYLLASEELEGWFRSTKVNGEPRRVVYLDVKWTGISTGWRFWESAAAWGGKLNVYLGSRDVFTSSILIETLSIEIPVEKLTRGKDLEFAIYGKGGRRDLQVASELVSGFLDESLARSMIVDSVWSAQGQEVPGANSTLDSDQ